MLSGPPAAVSEPPTSAAAVNGSEAVALGANEPVLEPVVTGFPLAERPATAPAVAEPRELELAATELKVPMFVALEVAGPEVVAPGPEVLGLVAPKPARGGAADSILGDAVVAGFELVALVRVTPVESPAGGFPVGELTPGANPTGLIGFLMPVAARSFDDVLCDVASAGPDALEGVAPLIGTPTGLEVPAGAGVAR